jgi:hypothetical protein
MDRSRQDRCAARRAPAVDCFAPVPRRGRPRAVWPAARGAWNRPGQAQAPPTALDSSWRPPPAARPSRLAPQIPRAVSVRAPSWVIVQNSCLAAGGVGSALPRSRVSIPFLQLFHANFTLRRNGFRRGFKKFHFSACEAGSECVNGLCARHHLGRPLAGKAGYPRQSPKLTRWSISPILNPVACLDPLG